MRAALVPHPTTPSRHVDSIAVAIGSDSQLLVVRYTVCGAIDKILWPEPAAATRSDALWEHTCFELFVGSTDNPGYFEFNFSPSAQWAAYRFDGYRAGMREHTLDRMPHIVCRYGANRMYLEATLGRDVLARARDARVRVGVSAVIEDDAASKTYWALAHPAGKPDFHHADAFALELGHAGAGIGQ